MKAVWKFTPLFSKKGEAIVRMPNGAEVLTAQMQDGAIRVWALVDPNGGIEGYETFHSYDTGEYIREDPGKYIATVQVSIGNVQHIFMEVAK